MRSVSALVPRSSASSRPRLPKRHRNRKHFSGWRPASLTLILPLVLGALAAPALAQNNTYTWSGGSDGHWNVAGNWSSAPPTTSANTALLFDVASNYTVINDYSNFVLNNLTFGVGAQSYNMSGGTLGFVSNGLGQAPTLVQNSSTGQVISSAIRLDNNLTLQGSGAGKLTLSGIVSGSGGLIQNGPFTTLLTGSNTYTGGTTINGGFLAIGADNNLGAAGGSLSLGGGGLQFTSSLISARAITLNTGGGTFDTNGNNNTLTGNISGSGGLVKVGTGNLTLFNPTTYTGSTTINGGTLSLGDTQALSTQTAVTVGANSALVLNNFSQSIGSLAGSGSVSLGTANLTTGNDNTSTTFSGSLFGSGGLVKAGNGTLTLTGSNTYTGNTTINGGTLALGSLQAL
ncbi:MAG: Extracellular serine protease precursor, partial [Bryobacterales bacterium]|nr:Extracellular serine protease precursor [Bryobacterales bacterium]